MSKTYNRSQFHKIMTDRVIGPELRQYGIPFTNIAGTISQRESKEILEAMLIAIEWFPEIHIISFMQNNEIYNRYVEGAEYYSLFRGNKDPEIMFTSVFCPDDISQEEIEEMNRYYENAGKEPLCKKALFYVQCQLNRLGVK